MATQNMLCTNDAAVVMGQADYGLWTREQALLPAET